MAWFIEGLETNEDRSNEVAVLEYAKKVTELNYIQTKKLTRYDAELYRDNELYAIVEIKCRKNCNHNTYPTAIIRTDKWYGCKKIAKEKDTEFIILFRYDDGVFWLNETNTELDLPHGRYVTKIKPFNNPYGEEEEVVNFPTRLLMKL
jgi:hypothetical protein